VRPAVVTEDAFVIPGGHQFFPQVGVLDAVDQGGQRLDVLVPGILRGSDQHEKQLCGIAVLGIEIHTRGTAGDQDGQALDGQGTAMGKGDTGAHRGAAQVFPALQHLEDGIGILNVRALDEAFNESCQGGCFVGSFQICDEEVR